uniref:DM domain-containing protein n=1 Tax=Caenorhabditis tropicalis TaxID=1561998 RepID=A0A1I7UFU2_9PELO
MVEQRRQLNNMLSKKKVHIAPSTQTRNGKRVRDPHCARCSAHGVLVPLRGHKRSMCQFVTCECQLCGLVENRRMLMAAQIKLRRSQQKSRDGKEPKTRRTRKLKEMDIEKLNEFMMVVTTDDEKRGGTSTSPSPSSTTDTMSPALSISPPPSPSPTTNSLTQTIPILAAPIPIYPSEVSQFQLQYQQLLINCLQSLNSPIQQTPPLLPTFLDNQQIEVLLYLKSCLKM